MAVIDDIAQHLHNQGIASLGTSLFKSYSPESPDNIVAVLDTGGTTPDPELPTKSPTFQVFIRNKSYVQGRSKLDSVRAALHQRQEQTLINGGTYFIYIFAIAEGGHLGRDENGRDLFSINFRAKTR